MKMKWKQKWFAGFLTLALGASLAAGCGGGSSAPTAGDKPKEYKVGVILDISGPGSSLGVPERDSIQMYEEEINKKGGVNGVPVKFVVMDNKSNEMESVTGVKKLINEDKVAAVVGASQSGTTIAMIDTATQSKVPLVSAAASIKIVTPPAERQWIFKTAQNDSVVAEKIVEYLKAKGLKKIAFLSVNNAYGDSGLVEFEKVAAASGIEIVAKEKFGANDTDMTPQLTSIKQKEPQSVVVWAIPPSASILTKNFKSLNLNIPLIHSHGVGNKNFIDLAGADAEGVVFASGKLLVADDLPDSDPQKKVLKEYVSAYEAKFGPRSGFGGYGRDAAALVVNALGKAGADPVKLRDELEKTSGYAGVSGVFTMTPEDHSGLTKDALVMVEIKDGKWRLVK